MFQFQISISQSQRLPAVCWRLVNYACQRTRTIQLFREPAFLSDIKVITILYVQANTITEGTLNSIYRWGLVLSETQTLESASFFILHIVQVEISFCWNIPNPKHIYCSVHYFLFHLIETLFRLIEIPFRLIEILLFRFIKILLPLIEKQLWYTKILFCISQ